MEAHLTEQQARLRQRSDDNAAWTFQTPGACNIGRMLGCDDPEQLGWETITAMIERDGVFGFRMIPTDRVQALSERLATSGYRLDCWDVFLGASGHVLGRSDAIVADGLSEGLSIARVTTSTDARVVERLQNLMLGAGVVPFSAAMLTGQVCPAATVVVMDAQGAPVAAGHTYLPHNRFSRYRRHAWGGLVAVDEQWRGKRLGIFINALVVRAAVRDLGAEYVYELVTTTNEASRRMVGACGLALEAGLKAGAATTAAERYTR